jgi:hypothetical protein
LEGDSVYITGFTGSIDFPMVNSFDPIHNGNWDCFVAKLTNGTDLTYSTFLGGTDEDKAFAIAVENGYVYVTGQTYSIDFPAINEYDNSNNGWIDCFVTKLAIDGQSLIYSTYLGGAAYDMGYGIAVRNNAAFIFGQTQSYNFPTVYAFNVTWSGDYDCFLSILSEDSDYDGLSDWHEEMYGTNPLSIDTDLDGATDAYEVEQDTDPTNPFSYPGVFSESEYMLAYSSYLGGSDQDEIYSIQVEDGFIYVAGRTKSSNFPMVNSWNTSIGLQRDVFIAKLAADGQSIIYSTFVGGNGDDIFNAMAVENSYVYACGETSSDNFPTYLAYDDKINGSEDGFLFKLDSDGSQPIYSTYLGGSTGSGSDEIWDVCVENGYVYVTGRTGSLDFPLVNEYWTGDSSTYDSFVTKFAADGQSLMYSTYLGGRGDETGYSICVENQYAYTGGYTTSSDFPTENAYDDTVNGLDIYLTKFSKDGRALVYSTYFGGTNTDFLHAIHVDRGFAYFTGYTYSSDFPLKNEIYDTYVSSHDGFIAMMDIFGTSLEFSTYLPGTGSDIPRSIVTDEGFVYVCGHTTSTDFPIVGRFTTLCSGTSTDAFLTKLSVQDEEVLYSSCFGGSDDDYSWSVDIYNDKVYFAGYTKADYPTVVAYNSTEGSGHDGFISILDCDSDFDYLPDFTEGVVGTCDFKVDTDNDNFLDGYEYVYGSDPLDNTSFPAIPQSWYDEIYEDLDGNATLIQNLITWSNGNWSLLETVKEQLDNNSTVLTQVISWLDGNHSAIQDLFAHLDGNATLLLETISWVDDNATMQDQILIGIQYLYDNFEANATLLLNTIDSLENNATLLEQVVSWLDGNHSAIQTLIIQLEGNATLLLKTVNAVNGNSSLIQNLLTWSAANETLLLTLIDQVNELDSTNATQVLEWLNGNHTQIEQILTYVEGNATLLLQTVNALNGNATQLDLVAALVTANTEWLQELNSTVIGNLTEIREVLDQLGVTVGDTDYDGLDDLDELTYGTDILCIDTDCDNLNDAFEVKIGTDPLDDDSDDDTYLDGIEVIAGTDPMDANDYPGVVTTTTTPTQTTTPTTTTTPPTTTTTSTTPPDGGFTQILIITVIGVGAGIGVVVVILFILRKRRAN